MNRKGEGSMAWILTAFMVVVIGSVLFSAIADQSAISTKTMTVVNQSISPTTNTTLTGNISLAGQAVSNFVATNGTTTGIVVGSGNYTINNYQDVNGEYLATLEIKVPSAYQTSGAALANGWYVSYTYEPSGYDTSSGNRTIIGLVVLFFALAIAFAVFPNLREWTGR